MAKSLGGFRAALLVGWVALGAAGVLYARFKGIPGWAALPALAAFLIAYPFYLVPAFPALRERLSGRWLFGYLAGCAMLPYLVCSLGAVEFHWSALGRLAAMALVFSLWYVVLPVHPATDLAFLAFFPIVLLGKYFNSIYVPLYPPLKDIIVLGHISLIEIVVMVLLLVRRVDEAGYGFVPNSGSGESGRCTSCIFALVGLPLALLLHAVRFAPMAPLWKIAATFVGVLWVLSLSEEFFLRGVLQQWMEEWTRSRAVALAITSCVFGLVHLWLGGRFPNWRWVMVAGILGWFCGRARNQAGSIRAGMVTHALVVTAWRAFFA